MGNLNNAGLTNLSKKEIKMISGGYVLYTEDILHAINWAYTQFKEGVDDGYNNR